MLIVDPQERLSADEALAHSFFEQVEDTSRYFVKPFNAKRKFRVSRKVEFFVRVETKVIYCNIKC